MGRKEAMPELPYQKVSDTHEIQNREKHRTETLIIRCAEGLLSTIPEISTVTKQRFA